MSWLDIGLIAVGEAICADLPAQTGAILWDTDDLVIVLRDGQNDQGQWRWYPILSDEQGYRVREYLRRR